LATTGTPILVEDLDGDGFLDMLLASTPESGFFRNDGKGRFTVQPGPLTDLLRTRERRVVAGRENEAIATLIAAACESW
jgi:hypothetical protein